MPELSIIVIIYNIEKYLGKCLESILEQTYTDYELILVDDGSTDHSSQICDDFAGRDPRIQVIHQSNQGSVSARWNGILATTGKYISIIDGDDWIDPDMFECMMKLGSIQNADIVAVGYKTESKAGTEKRSNKIASGIYSGENIKKIYQEALYTGEFYTPGIIPAFWNKLIKRALFFQDYLPADQRIKLGDDAAVVYPMIARAQTIVIDNEFTPYHYRIVEGSLSRAYDEAYFSRAEVLVEGLNKNLEDYPDMVKQLPYYTLFILSIGIDRFFSRAIQTPLKAKNATVKNATEKIKEIISFDNVDWSGFKKAEKTRFRILLTGNMPLFSAVYFLSGRIDRIICLFRKRNKM